MTLYVCYDILSLTFPIDMYVLVSETQFRIQIMMQIMDDQAPQRMRSRHFKYDPLAGSPISKLINFNNKFNQNYSALCVQYSLSTTRKTGRAFRNADQFDLNSILEFLPDVVGIRTSRQTDQFIPSLKPHFRPFVPLAILHPLPTQPLHRPPTVQLPHTSLPSAIFFCLFACFLLKFTRIPRTHYSLVFSSRPPI